MGNMSIRKIPDEVHNAIKARAKKAGRSAEEEVRLILQEAIFPSNSPQFLNLDDVFAEFRRRTGGVELGDLRDRKDRKQVDFSEWFE